MLPTPDTGSGVDGDVLATTELLIAHPWAAAFCPAGFIKASSELAQRMKRWQFKSKR